MSPMPSDQDEVPAGAVIAAMQLIKGLGNNENAMPEGELLIDFSELK